jgi:hypothetical protein
MQIFYGMHPVNIKGFIILSLKKNLIKKCQTDEFFLSYKKSHFGVMIGPSSFLSPMTHFVLANLSAALKGTA